MFLFNRQGIYTYVTTTSKLSSVPGQSSSSRGGGKILRMIRARRTMIFLKLTSISCKLVHWGDTSVIIGWQLGLDWTKLSWQMWVWTNVFMLIKKSQFCFYTSYSWDFLICLQLLMKHFKSIPVVEKDTLSFFFYTVKTNANKLDQKNGLSNDTT